MKGRIKVVGDFERKDQCGDIFEYREIVVRIDVPRMPYQPVNYTPDWKGIQEQQSPFNDDKIKQFKQYEKEMEEYHKAMDELDSFHIGDVSITQKKVGEVSE